MTAGKFPTALLALVNVGGEVPNFGEAQLDGQHAAGVATLNLRTAPPAWWPTAGFVTIDSEIKKYTGKGAFSLTGVTGGQESANGASADSVHPDGATVGFYNTALQFNQVVADLIATQTKIGTGASAPAGTTKVLQATGAGTSAWQDVTTDPMTDDDVLMSF